MKPGFAPPLALDVNVDKKYLMTLSIKQLISNLRTAYRMADFDNVEKVLEEQQSMMKAEMKVLREKLELETLVRMSIEEECKERLGRYERMLESVKKNTELDYENTIADLRMRNAELEDEKRRTELEVESWKRRFKERFEEWSEQLLMVGKGVNLSINVNTRVGIGGKDEGLPSIQGNIDAGLSDEVMGEKDMDVVHICDNEQGNTTAGSSPSQRKDLKFGNSPVGATKVTRQCLDSPNKALLVASGISAEDTDKPEDNEVDMDNHECKNIAADSSSSQGVIDDCGNENITVDDEARQSKETPNLAVLGISDATTKNATDIYDQECGNAAADTSTSQGMMDDCGNAHVDVDDDARQSRETPNSVVLGASDATIKNAVDIVDHECGNIAASTSPSQGKTDDCGNSAANTSSSQEETNDGGNTHVGVEDDVEWSTDTPNTIVLGASDAAIENAIVILDHECGNTAGIAPSQTKIDDCGNAHFTIDDGTRQSLDTPETVVLGALEPTTGEAIDIHDHEFGDPAADISPSERKTEDCENTCGVIDDDARQSPNTPNTAVLGASGSQKVVIEIEDDDDDDDECITTGALNGNEAKHDIAASVDSIIEPLKRKWFPEAGNSFVGLNDNVVDGSDSDDDSSSSASSLESGINMVQLPSNFLRSIGDKRRKL